MLVGLLFGEFLPYTGLVIRQLFLSDINYSISQPGKNDSFTKNCFKVETNTLISGQ